MLQYVAFQNVCVSRLEICWVILWLHCIANVWAFQSGFPFLSRFYCKCTRFCVDISF